MKKKKTKWSLSKKSPDQHKEDQNEEEEEKKKDDQNDEDQDGSSILRELFLFAVAIALFVIYLGITYQNIDSDLEKTFFNQPDHCKNNNNLDNATNFEYGLESLRTLGQVEVPKAVTVASLDLDDPKTWITGGDSIKLVAEGDYFHVSVESDMSGISGGMLRDWLETVSCSEQYRWWHPKDHEFGVWVDHEDYKASSSLVGRQGKIHRVKERIGGNLVRLDIFFGDPCVGKDCEALRSEGVDLVLYGSIHAHIAPMGRVYTGYFTHVLRVSDNGSTLHSRFSVGRDIHCLDNPNSWSCIFLNTFQGALKGYWLTEEWAGALFTHCKEEMFVLGRLIAKMNKVALKD